MIFGGNYCVQSTASIRAITPSPPPPLPDSVEESSSSAFVLSKNKLSAIETLELIELLHLQPNINHYTAVELEDLTHKIRRILRKKQKLSHEDTKLYALFCQQFDASYEVAKSRALELHPLFSKAFPTTFPEYHRDNSRVVVDYEQFDFVQELLKKNFAGFFALADSPKQNRQLNHLACLILFGDPLSDCFRCEEAIEFREILHNLEGAPLVKPRQKRSTPPPERKSEPRQWDWKTDKQLVEKTILQIAPTDYEKSLKQQVRKFFCQLEQLSLLKKCDQLVVTPFAIFIRPAPQSWSATFAYYLPSLSSSQGCEAADEQLNYLYAKRLQDIIGHGMKLYDKYMKRLDLLAQPTKLPQELARLLRGALIGLRRFQQDESYTNLIQWVIDKILPKLPFLVEDIEDCYNNTGVIATFIKLVETCRNAFFDSNNGYDYEWKVARYQSILKQLRAGIAPIIAETFSKNISQSSENALAPFISIKTELAPFIPIKTEHEGIKALQDLVDHLYNLVNLDISDPKEFELEYLGSLRVAYSTHVIDNLRRCIQNLEAQEDQKIISCIGKICTFLYTKINLEKECFALNEKFYQLGMKNFLELKDKCNELDIQLFQKKPSTESYLLERVDRMYSFFCAIGRNHKTTLTSQVCKSVKDHFNFGFDSIREGNPPHRLGELCIQQGENQKIVNCIACGSTTIEGWWLWGTSYATNNGIFYECMKNYKEEGKSHLFVINQDYRASDSWVWELFDRIVGGVETDRINAIIEIANGFEKTFFPIVLSKNSDFFKQSGIFEKQSKAKLFKEELIKQYFEHRPSVTGNFIPPHVMQKIVDLKGQSIVWVNAIHEIMFRGKLELTVKQRQVFYDLYQDILVLYMIVILNVDSYNISCKDAIDRAADSNSRLWAHTGLVHNMEREPLFRERFEIRLFSRALMVRKREINRDRFNRNRLTVGFYERYKIRLQKLHKLIFQSLSIRPINTEEVS